MFPPAIVCRHRQRQHTTHIHCTSGSRYFSRRCPNFKHTFLEYYSVGVSRSLGAILLRGFWSWLPTSWLINNGVLSLSSYRTAPCFDLVSSKVLLCFTNHSVDHIVSDASITLLKFQFSACESNTLPEFQVCVRC
jgi:hypothetical protein